LRCIYSMKYMSEKARSTFNSLFEMPRLPLGPGRPFGDHSFNSLVEMLENTDSTC